MNNTSIKLLLSTFLIVIIAGCSKEDAQIEKIGTFTDSRDGKTYNWVNINGEKWMAENLAFKPDTDYFDYAPNIDLVDIYGYLYNIEGALKACPKGWHLPSRKEWEDLISSQGGENIAGGKLKDTGTTYWNSPNTGANNASGFAALPGGIGQIHPIVGFVVSFVNYKGFWQTPTIDTLAGLSTVFEIGYNSGKIFKSENSHSLYLSVRCIND